MIEYDRSFARLFSVRSFTVSRCRLSSALSMSPACFTKHRACFLAGLRTLLFRLEFPRLWIAALGLLFWLVAFCVPAGATPAKETPTRAAMRLLKAECFVCHGQEK